MSVCSLLGHRKGETAKKDIRIADMQENDVCFIILVFSLFKHLESEEMSSEL